jgi:hypothetical protein
MGKNELEIMMENASNPKYVLAAFAFVGLVLVVFAFVGREDGQSKSLASGLASMGAAGEQAPKWMATPGHDEARPGCGSSALSPFGNGAGCTEVQPDAGEAAASNSPGADDFDEVAASNEELAARLKLMTSKALAGDTGAFGWYIHMYTDRCYQLDPSQLAAITECDPALRSRVDAQFVQVASRLAAANNTEAQLALGRWYLSQGAKKLAQTWREANADGAATPTERLQQVALAENADTGDRGLSGGQNAMAGRPPLPEEYKTAAQWFARAAPASPSAADYLAFTNGLLGD